MPMYTEGAIPSPRMPSPGDVERALSNKMGDALELVSDTAIQAAAILHSWQFLNPSELMLIIHCFGNSLLTST